MPFSTTCRFAALLFVLPLFAPVALAQPDLTVLGASSEESSGDPGDRVSLEFNIGNFGDESADEFLIGYYFSTDGTFSSDDVFAEDENGNDIDPGDVEDESEQITVPPGLDPGDYFILIVVDYTDIIFESDETNNTGAVAFQVTGEGGAGSVDGGIGSDDGDVDATGGTVTYTVTLSNSTNASQQVTAEVNATLPDGSQRLLRGPTTVTLQSGQSVMRSFTEQVPAAAPSGSYSIRLTARANGVQVVSDSFTFNKGNAPGAQAAAARVTTDGAFPNPFSEQTTIRYEVEEAVDVRLAVYDMLGREVAVLTDGLAWPGTHEVAFDGRGLSSGLYVWHLRTGDTVQSGRINLVR